MNKANVIFFIALFTILSVTSGCSKKEYYEEKGIIFNTYFTIKYEADRSMREKIDGELTKFSLSLNPFHPNSVISKINRNEDVTVDAWFAHVFNKAAEVSEKTDGFFDITCAPLINLWGFGFSRMDSITPSMVDSIREFVGYKKVRLDGKKIHKDDPRLLLNCSAIAKGFACDVIAEMLEKEGIENYMVDIGGEFMMKGKNNKGEHWIIGIYKPADDSTGNTDEVEKIIQLRRKGGIATSGNYRNFYMKDGKKFAHTINPHTGYPAEQNILSATVVANDCMTADAYATAFMAMGLDSARQIGASTPEIDYFLIYAGENGTHLYECSSGMLQYFKK